MIGYELGQDVGELEPWPFDAPESRYRIIDGAPRASGRLDAGGPGHPTRTGIWRCTPGTLECIEQGDELMAVLTGEGSLTDLESGEVQRLAPGRTIFVRDGMQARWTVTDTLTKAFFGAKPGGY